MRTKLYFSLFVAFCIIAVNYYANIYDVYWLFPGFDIPMHILGGFMVGLFTLTGLDHIKGSKKLSIISENFKFIKNKALTVLLATIIVGVVWESIEYCFGLTDGLGAVSRFDTIKDLIDDIIGGVLSIWFWDFIFNKTKITKTHDK